MRVFALFIATAWSLVGCNTILFYELPSAVDQSEFASIEEAELRDVWGIRIQTYQLIRSIDRKIIQRQGMSRKPVKQIRPPNSDHGIHLAPGTHLIHIVACIDTFNLFVDNYCADAVLKLHTKPGTSYRVNAIVNRNEDFAEIWIEDMATSAHVTEVIRVDDLRGNYSIPLIVPT